MSSEGYKLAEIGALIGDPTRASMLTELMAGRALTAGELACVAQITAQTASAHLGKLSAARLIRIERQGRHRYVRIASSEVAHMLEAMLVLTARDRSPRAKPPRVHGALKRARFCYDHLAGELGVALCDAWIERRWLILHEYAAEITDDGLAFGTDFGLQLMAASKSRRPLCRTCLDWSERRPHLAGRLGAVLAERMLARGWIARERSGRTVQLTAAGIHGVLDVFGIELAAG